MVEKRETLWFFWRDENEDLGMKTCRCKYVYVGVSIDVIISLNVKESIRMQHKLFIRTRIIQQVGLLVMGIQQWYIAWMISSLDLFSWRVRQNKYLVVRASQCLYLVIPVTFLSEKFVDFIIHISQFELSKTGWKVYILLISNRSHYHVHANFNQNFSDSWYCD